MAGKTYQNMVHSVYYEFLEQNLKLTRTIKKTSKYHSRPDMLWDIGIESKSNKDNRNY